MTDSTNPPGTEGSDRQRVTGHTDHPQHRAGEGEGVRAPLAEDGADNAQISVFDGKGNESVAVLTDDESGKPRQGTGPDAATALSDAKDPSTVIGGAFSPEEDQPQQSS